MRQRSLTNSRPGENLKLRRSYADAHPICEFGQHLPDYFNSGRAEECHHIATNRHDVVSNLLRLSAENHRWCEDFKADGRIVALYVKLVKEELDPDEFREASGVLLPGYILMQSAKLRHEWVKPLAEELKRAFP